MAPDLRVVGPGEQPDPRAISYQVIVDDLTAVRNSIIECEAEAAELPGKAEPLRIGLSKMRRAVDVLIALAQEVQRQ